MITTTARTVYEGPRNLIMLFTGVSDGAGQETNVVKVDVSELAPACASVKLICAEYEVSGGILQLLWGADDPVAFDNLASVGQREYEWSGGLGNAGVAAPTGDLMFSTVGFDVGSSYSVLLNMVKKY